MRRLLVLLTLLPCLVFAKDNLEIYWIDVEGGAATLIVTPGGQTVLMDTGWPGFDDRDPKRVAHVLEHEVGRKELDYFITSHFHLDHVGGLPGLAKLIQVKEFVDHGDSVEIDWDGQRGDRARKLWDGYLSAAKGKRMQIKPGDTLPVDGVEFLFVAARSKFLDEPLAPTAANPLCAGAVKKERDEGENGKSVGFLVRMGDFEFLDLGDLSWNFELETACPKKRTVNFLMRSLKGGCGDACATKSDVVSALRTMATYEKGRQVVARDPGYRVDAAKLIPLTWAVIGLLVVRLRNG